MQQGSGDEGNTDGTNGDEDDLIPGGDDETNGDATTDEVPHLNLDDRLVIVGNALPAFGGMYFEPGDDVLQVFMLDIDDPEQAAAIEEAIRAEFPNAIRSGGIKLVQGNYSIVHRNSRPCRWFEQRGSCLVLP